LPPVTDDTNPLSASFQQTETDRRTDKSIVPRSTSHWSAPHKLHFALP